MSATSIVDFTAAAEAVSKGQSLRERAGLSRDLIRVLYAAAVAKYESGQYEEAVVALHELTVLDAYQADHWALTGNAFMRLGRFTEAVTAWRMAMTLAPSFATAATVVRTAIALKDREASAEALMVARRHRLTAAHQAEYAALLDHWNALPA